MKTVFALMFLAVTICNAGQTCENVDIIAVIPGSSSVGQSNYDIIIDHVSNTTKALFTSLDTKLQFGAVEYAEKDLVFQNVKVNESDKFNILELGTCNSVQCVDGSLQNVTYLEKASNNFGYGLERAMDVEFQKSSKYPNASKIIILFTDGPADDTDMLNARYQKSQAEGIMTYAIGIGERVVLSELQMVANGGASNDSVYIVDDFNSLPPFMLIANAIAAKVCKDDATTSVMTTVNVTQSTSNVTSGNEMTTSAGQKSMDVLIIYVAIAIFTLLLEA